jgi:hypothetical protein
MKLALTMAQAIYTYAIYKNALVDMWWGYG